MSEKQTPLTDLLRGVPSDGRAIEDELDADGRCVSSHFIPYGRMCHEAADELTRLRAENEAMRAQLSDVAEIAETRRVTIDARTTELCQLEAENDALRAVLLEALETALEALELGRDATSEYTVADSMSDAMNDVRSAIDAARAALKETT